jgi:ParB/RepB/Spo0J family partition protein
MDFPGNQGESMKVKEIAIENIVEDPTNRKAGGVDIIQSIGTLGVLQPILVRLEGDIYKVVAGARRLASARHFDLKTVPCIISSENNLLAQAAENFDRKGLNPLDESDMILALEKDGMTREAVAGWLNLTPQQVAKREKLGSLITPIKNLVKSGQLSASVAAELSVVPEEFQHELLDDNYEPIQAFTIKDARNKARRCGSKYLSRAIPDLVSMEDRKGRCCDRCPECEGSSDMTLFEESDEKVCHNRTCFTERLCEYIKRNSVPFISDDPRLMERSESLTDTDEWMKINNWERNNFPSVIAGIDDDGKEAFFARIEKKGTVKPVLDDPTKEARKAFNSHIDEMNAIYDQIVKATSQALVEYYKGNITDYHEIDDMVAERAFQSSWTLDQYNLDGVNSGSHLKITKDNKKTKEEILESKAILFARTMLVVYTQQPLGWRKASPHCFPLPPERDNGLTTIASIYIPGWFSSDLRAHHDITWEKYLLEQWELGGYEPVKKLLNKAGNYDEKKGLGK